MLRTNARSLSPRDASRGPVAFVPVFGTGEHAGLHFYAMQFVVGQGLDVLIKSLFRLRQQRRLKRTDFAPLTAKTIARIERNEVAKPHGTTLNAIAKRLRIAPDEIADY